MHQRAGVGRVFSFMRAALLYDEPGGAEDRPCALRQRRLGISALLCTDHRRACNLPVVYLGPACDVSGCPVTVGRCLSCFQDPRSGPNSDNAGILDGCAVGFAAALAR